VDLLLSESFSASLDYQKLFSGSNSESFAYVGTSARCLSYKATWNAFDFQPNFTSNFEAAVAGGCWESGLLLSSRAHWQAALPNSPSVS
jgi:hypothetical protein